MENIISYLVDLSPKQQLIFLVASVGLAFCLYANYQMNKAWSDVMDYERELDQQEGQV